MARIKGGKRVSTGLYLLSCAVSPSPLWESLLHSAVITLISVLEGFPTPEFEGESALRTFKSASG